MNTSLRACSFGGNFVFRIGFWGEWKSQGDGIHIVLDEKGEEVQYPYGVFCAVRSNVSPPVGAGWRSRTLAQRKNADFALHEQPRTSAALDPELFGR